jgi:uncharacterized protein involved in exopolysaccharide biosynthesis
MENVRKNQGDFSVKDMVINTSSLFRYLVHKWKPILAFCILGLLGGIGYSLIKKPVYIATTTFTVEAGGQSAGGGLSGIAEQFGLDVGGEKGNTLFEADNLVLFFQSRAMVQKTLLSSGHFGNLDESLANRYLEFNGYRQKWKGKNGLENISFAPNQQQLSRLQDSVLGVFYKDIIKKNLDVEKVDKKLDVLGLNFKCKDELFAKEFAERLSANVVDFYVNNKTGKTQKNVDVLQRQTDSVRRVLNSSIEGEAESNDQAPNANPLRQLLRVPSQKKEVDVEASEAVLTELVKNLELAKIELRKETPLIQYIDTPILPLDNDKVSLMKGASTGATLGLLVGVIILALRKIFKSVLA